MTHSAESGGARLLPLDALKGIIMIMMAVDHASFFIARQHPTGEFWGGALPHYDSAFGFLTRFVTHPVAPGFFFMMGVGMVLFAASRRRKGWSEAAITRHFLLRGSILIILQQFIENPAWLLGPAASLQPPGGGGVVFFHFGVLFALGASMIVCALLFRLGSALLLVLALAAFLATEILIPDPGRYATLYSPILRLLLIPGQTGIVQVYYSLIPWIGLVGFGMVFGRWILSEHGRAYRWSLLIGTACLFLFFVVRLIGGFGNIRAPEGPGWIAFLNVTKYPPSIAFVLPMLGFNLLLLGSLHRMEGLIERWGRPAIVFGQSALFFYIIHLYIYGVMSLFFGPEGTGLLLMYLFWFIGLLLLYPLCRSYGRFKHRQAPESLWRLF